MSAAPRGAHGEQGLSRPRRVPSPSPAAAPTLRYPSPAPAGAGDRGPVEPLPPASQARPPGLEGGGSGPRGARRNVQDVPRGAEKSSSVGAARLPKTGGLSLGYLSPKPPPITAPLRRPNNQNTTLNGGSLGSWVDEDRSKLRVVV